MQLKISERPEFLALRNVLIDTIHAREKRFLVPKPYYEGSQIDWIVKRLTLRSHVALSRIWVVRKSYRCYNCAWQKTCDPQSVCLNLVTSYGNSRSDQNYNYQNTYSSTFGLLPLYQNVLGHLDPDFQHLHIIDRFDQIIIGTLAQTCHRGPGFIDGGNHDAFGDGTVLFDNIQKL